MSIFHGPNSCHSDRVDLLLIDLPLPTVITLDLSFHSDRIGPFLVDLSFLAVITLIPSWWTYHLLQ